MTKRQKPTYKADLPNAEIEVSATEEEKGQGDCTLSVKIPIKCARCNGTGEIEGDYCHCGEPADGSACDNHTPKPMIEPCPDCVEE